MAPASGQGIVAEGTLVIDAGSPPFRGATAHVYLEDISYADAPAVIAAEVAISDVIHEPAANGGRDTVIPFSLQASAAAIADDNDYALRAWIDLDGDGDQGPGDLYSDQAYRVLTRGFGRTATIRLGSG